MFCGAVDCAHLRVFQGAAGAGESSIDAAGAGQASDANAVRSRHAEPILHKVNLAPSSLSIFRRTAVLGLCHGL